MMKKRYNVGNFVVFRFDRDQNEEFTLYIPPEDIGKPVFRAMQTIGGLTVIDPNGNEYFKFSEGQSTDEKPKPYMPGIWRYICHQGPAQRLCLNHSQKYKDFSHEPVSAPDGYEFTIPKGGIFVLGKGSVKSGDRKIDAFAIIQAESGDVKLTVVDWANGLLAWE